MFNNFGINAQKISGFTLVELMITMVIIAVLASIALPSYQNYIKRANIKSAQTDLVSLSLVLENYYQRNLTYPSQDYANTSAVLVAFPQWTASTDMFDFSSKNSTIDGNKGYTLVATAENSNNLQGCILKIDSNNERTATASCEGKTLW